MSQAVSRESLTGEPGDEPLICSGKGCRAPAVWALKWNNPKIHTADRRKVWLACDEHRDHLETFLGARSFLKETVPVGDLAAESPAGEPRGNEPPVPSPDRQ